MDDDLSRYYDLCDEMIQFPQGKSMRYQLKNNVQRLRQAAKLTQEELGLRVGVTRQTIIAIEKGNYTPSVTLALKIAQYFNIQVEDVFILEE